jgi:hypothetical protein
MRELVTTHQIDQTTPDVAAVMGRVRAEFIELPGLRLTEPQAMRLWSLDAALCAGILSSLVASGFLVRTPSAMFARA